MPAPAFVPFRQEDFRLYEARNRGDETLNGMRLVVRQKLQAIGERAAAELKKLDIGLERRESLHHPFSVNHFRVVAQWTSLFRDAKARKEFARAVGPDLGKDVDPGHANCAFFVSIDETGLQFGLRLGVEAWYDAQNFVNRCAKSDAASDEWRELLHRAPGFHVRIHDWETRFPTATMNRDEARDVFKYFQVGQHRLTCARTFVKDEPGSFDASFFDTAVDGLVALASVYRFMAWSPANNFLLRDAGGFRK